MKSQAGIQAGVCGFKVKVTAVCEDGMHVALKIGSDCDTIKTIGKSLMNKGPINMVMDLHPKTESAILAEARPILTAKGCCEGCAVPAGILKTAQVAAGLALPKDVVMNISKVSET